MDLDGLRLAADTRGEASSVRLLALAAERTLSILVAIAAHSPASKMLVPQLCEPLYLQVKAAVMEAELIVTEHDRARATAKQFAKQDAQRARGFR